MSEKVTQVITKKELNSIFWRSMLLQLSWNYERMQSVGYCYSILPALKKIYANNPDHLNEAVTRNLEFFNTQPYMALPIMGISVAMEESKEFVGNIDASSISAVKVAMMGPLAGLGDSFFWFTVYPITASIGVSLAANGSMLGAIAYLVLFNIFSIAFRVVGLEWGYKYGSAFVERMNGSGIMQRITEGTTIVGLMVMGVMTATMVSLPMTMIIGEGDSAMSLEAIFDAIMPGLIPLALVLACYWLLRKGITSTKVLFLLIGLCIVGAYVGLF
jgi:mannose/fructose/sorbose-specific phosphotransferase system IID component